MPKLSHSTAFEYLFRAGVPVGSNYHALDSNKVENLIKCADEYGYRHPKNANGSRARYWHDFLQRVAARS